MEIVKITVQHLKVPFNDSFSHASAERNEGDSLLVIVSLGDGTIGHGEGCPRSYVTGESFQGAAVFIHDVSPSVKSAVHDIETLGDWINSNEALIDKNQSAWCALELAIIDALAKSLSVAATSLLNIEALTGRSFKYTAVIGGGSCEKLTRYMKAYSSFQFDDFKIKLTGDLDLDIARIDQFHSLSPASRLRLDANNLWSDPLVAANYLRNLPDIFFAIEEPVIAKDLPNLIKLSKLIRQKIILDESFTSMKDLDFIKQHKDRFIANIRVSKLGGLIRSRTITEQMESSGISYIIGAHVGETSILTRAAMMLGSSNTEYLLAREGAAGEYLLHKDICEHSIMFGHKGIYQDHCNSPGIGYKVNLDDLTQWPKQ